MKLLKLHQVNDQLPIAENDENPTLSLDSPAPSAMHDFRQHPPLTIDQETALADARTLFSRTSASFRLCTDSRHLLTGLINAADLSKQHELLKQGQGYDRNLLTARDMMTPIGQLQAIDFSELESATVGHLLNTLQRSGLHHCLVTDDQTSAVVGLICADDLCRALNASLHFRKAPSFVELFNALHIAS